LDLCKGSGLRIVNGRKLGDICGNFTCFSHRGTPSLIDYMLCDTDIFDDVEFFQVNELNPLSIHCLITCKLRAGWKKYKTPSQDLMQLHDLPAQFSWSSKVASLWELALNRDDIKSDINLFLSEFVNVDISVDTCLDKYYELLRKISYKAGLKRIKSKKRVKTNKKQSWYDYDCKLIYRQLKSLSRSIKQQPNNLTLIHSYRKIRKGYFKLLSSKKSAFRRKIFQKLDDLQSNDPQAFWNIYNDLCVSKKDMSNPISPKKWWEHFLTLMNRNISHHDVNFENHINDFVSNLNVGAIDSLDFVISPSEIIQAAKHLKNGKAAGIDGIRPEMIKEGIDTFAPALANLFNLIFQNGKFPSQWRTSSLTVIHKKGDKNTPSNYRGIAVSSNLCKLFCIVLYNRLYKFVNNNSVIPKQQIGFQKGSRTSDHILVLKSLIDRYINRAGKSYLYVCFIDFSKAFDTVWRNALLYKSIHVGIGGKFLHIIKDMYSSVSFAIKCDDKITDSFQTSVGVKQGCVLSPIFFNIFLHDLPNIFDASCDPVTLNNSFLSCLMYADDLILISESAKGLQCALDRLYDYCNKWKLLVNIRKSNVMIFNKSGHMLKNYTFKYGDVTLDLTNEYCYLGIIFVPSGSFNKAMNQLKDKANKAYFKIRDNLYSSSVACSLKLFNTLIQPILNYGSEVWLPYLLKNLNDTNITSICDKLPGESLHVKVGKLILGVNKRTTNNAVRSELGCFPMLLFTMNLSVKYWWFLNNQCLHGSKALVIDALLDNRRLCDTGLFSWSSGIKQILTIINRLDIWDKPNLLTKHNFQDNILSNLKSIYDVQCLSFMSNHQPKLRSYCLFKTNFHLENYVVMFNRSFRLNFSKLRLSAHSLMIEKGRHVTPKLDPHKRICNLCTLNVVEDEFHFIIKCPFYDTSRRDMLRILSDMYDKFDNLTEDDKFIKIMSVTDFDSIKPVLNFVNSAFKARSNLDV